jgi:ppGpp synthetase/RelA/SpoT-type nucleotidyltranferase/tetratricopeptide (TPR) repeat protein
MTLISAEFVFPKVIAAMNNNTSDNDMILRCREVYDAAAELERIILPHLRKVAGNTKIYTFKHRLKSPSSMYLKILRKRRQAQELREKEEPTKTPNDIRDAKTAEINRLAAYSPDDITDCFGCRYVTLFQEQIADLVSFLFEEVHAYNERSTTPLVLKELVVYTSRLKTDTMSISDAVSAAYRSTAFAQSDAAKGAKVRDGESRQNAYTSVHVTLETKLILDFPGRRCAETARVEVQLRDIFEEGWGEIDHFVRYSEKDDLDEGEESEGAEGIHRDHLKTDLRNLKEAVNTCQGLSKSAFSSHSKIYAAPSPSLDYQSATPRETDLHAILEGLGAGTSKEGVEALERAYSELMAAARATSRDAAIGNYHAAAESLAKAKVELAPFLERKLANRGDMPVSYFIDMEIGNAHLFTDDPVKIQKAITIFQRVSEKFPKDPVSRLRLARAIITGKNIQESRYEEAEELLREAFELYKYDVLTRDQPWIGVALQIQISFVTWKKSDLLRNSGKAGEAARALKEAAKSALAGYRQWEDLPLASRQEHEVQQHAHKALSNLLYYCAQILKLGETDETFNAAALRGWVDKIVQVGDESHGDYFKTLDNMMQAQLALGDQVSAKELAKRIFNIFQGLASSRSGRDVAFDEIAAFLGGDEIVPFRAAVRVLVEA